MGDLFSPGLIGEELVDGTYHPLDVYTDESGALRGHSPTLGLDLCVRDDNELRLFDPADGTWLLRSRDKSRVISEQREALREQAAEIERASRPDGDPTAVNADSPSHPCLAMKSLTMLLNSPGVSK